MVLACDIAPAREQVLHGLINAAVPVGKLVRITAGGKRQELITQANTEDRLVEIGQQAADLFNEGSKILRVSRTVPDHNAVNLIGKVQELRMPRCPDNADTTLQERAYNVVLDADIDHQDG